jgi:hypothetical protein
MPSCGDLSPEAPKRFNRYDDTGYWFAFMGDPEKTVRLGGSGVLQLTERHKALQ